MVALAAALAGCAQGVNDLGGGGSSPFGTPTAGATASGTGDTTATPSMDTEGSETTSLSGGEDGSTGTPQDAECGNGALEDGEGCDGDDFGGVGCADYGYDDGVLVCSTECALLTDGCYTCGDGQRSLTEVCDAADFAGETCESLGYGGGTLTCAADCASVDTSACTPLASCGDGVRNGAEQCDGPDLGGASCASLGFDQGNLGCNAGSCTHNTSGCSYLNCAGQGDFCLFDESNPQANCCPPGVGGNDLGLCVIAVCQ